MKDTDQSQTDSIIRFIVKQYKPLIIFPMIAAIAGFIFSFTLPKKYEAHAEIFPTYFTNVDQNIENPMFGYDIEADRLLKILRSESLKDSIVSKFNLFEYWDIDTNNKNYRFFLNKKYEKNIGFKRTAAMSIVISVYTYDADFSVKIVDEILNQVDIVRERMIKSNIQMAFETNKMEVTKIQVELDSLIARIKKIREDNNIYYPSLQQNMVLSSNSETYGAVRTDLEKLENEYSVKYDYYKIVYAKMKKAEQTVNAPISKVYVLDRASTDYKKKSPRIIYNTAGAFFVAFFIVLVFLLFKSEWNKRTLYAHKNK